MKSSIAILGLFASVHAASSLSSTCTESAVVHYATMTSVRGYTATLSTLPTDTNAASGSDNDNYSNAAASTQNSDSSDSRSNSGSGRNHSPSNDSSKDSTLEDDSTESNAAESLDSNSADSQAQPTINISSSMIPSDPSATSAWSTKSRITPNAQPTNDGSYPTAASAGNASATEYVPAAYTGSSSRTTVTGGAMVFCFMVSVFLF